MKPSTVLRALTWVSDRMNLGGKTFGLKRDLWDALGYKTQIDFADYRRRYRRGGLAKTVVRLPVDFTWQRAPIVYETEDPDEQTEFETVLRDVVRRTRLWSYLRRADRLSRVGRYSVIFLGFADGDKSFESPVGTVGEGAIAGVSVFSEAHATVKELGTRNKEPERIGLPVMYEIDFTRGGSTKTVGGASAGVVGSKRLVHWSRVIHVVDDPEEDDVYGVPALEASWNDFDDLEKARGAAAESAWRNMDRGIAWTIDKDAQLGGNEEETEAALDTINQQIEERQHNLRRDVIFQGITPTPLGVEVPDPTGLVNTIVGQIAGTHRIPQRILLGSERGNLASTQDRENMAVMIRDRQSNHVEHTLVRATLDRLIDVGVLPMPKNHEHGPGAYGVDWPDPLVSSSAERAEIAELTARAADIVSRINRGARTYTADEFREDLGRAPLDDDEADDEDLGGDEPVEAPEGGNGTDPNAGPVQ